MQKNGFLLMSFIIVSFFFINLVHSGTITVNTNNDNNLRDNVITLRESIMLSEGSLLYGDLTIYEQSQIITPVGAGEPDIINFSIYGIISPTSTLPDIIDNRTLIDASSQWDGLWPGGMPGVTLDGSLAGNSNGLGIYGAGCHIRGLFITRFQGNGISIGNAQSNIIGGRLVGFRNIISQNGIHGIEIAGATAESNRIAGNYIGTDASGTVDLGNSGDGVIISGGAHSNAIGGATAPERNIISGNNANGVEIIDPGTEDNVVAGNYIGMAVDGINPIGNSFPGVRIENGAQSNIIGGESPGERNIISGNYEDGVKIAGSGTMGNLVSGNYIGTDMTGAFAVGNVWCGVRVENGAQSNTIGGVTPAKRNVISGNKENGVRIAGSDTMDNAVLGNYIGTDATGTVAIGNTWRGVRIENGAQSNAVGGGSPEERNIISGNYEDGVAICGSGTDNNTVSSNYIGLDVTGTVDLGNLWFGVRIENGPQSNIVGGRSPEDRNIISGNQEAGIGLMGSGTENNIVIGNYIGTDYSGNASLGNSYVGVGILDAHFNTIGGRTPRERNIISGNFIGVGIGGTSSDNSILGNYIGTDASGTLDLGNEFAGVGITDEAYSNTIGGRTPRERNVISGNDEYGIGIDGSGLNNMVLGNYIGTDVNGIGSLGNDDGIYCLNSFLVIQGNTISKNRSGIRCEGTANPDLGGGPEIRYGFNAIYDNLNYNVYNDTVNTIMAEYNWWGQDPPDPDQLYGPIDYIPWLSCPMEVSFVAEPSELDALRSLRDTTLLQNATGQHLIDAYYRNTPELIRIFIQNRDLCFRSNAILMELMPGIYFLAGKQNGRDIIINSLLVIRIQQLLRDICAESSNDLAVTLSGISRMLDNYKGMRISRIWRLLN